MYRQFSISLERFKELTLAKYRTVFMKTCLDLSAGVIDDTPVDTGRARANWQPSVKFPEAGTLESTDPTGDAAKANVVRVLSDWEPGDSFILVNNLPYIGRLEDGSSEQAPQGMLLKNIARFPGAVERFVRNLPNGGQAFLDRPIRR